MAETKRMTAEQVVSYLLEGEGLDFLRESNHSLEAVLDGEKEARQREEARELTAA